MPTPLLKTRLIRVLSLASCAFLGGCPSFSSYTRARTITEGEVQVFVAPQIETLTLGTSPLTEPQIEFGARYGLTPNVEIGGKIWVPGFLLDGKFQLHRSATELTGWDICVVPGIGYLGGFSGTRSGTGSSLQTATFYAPILFGYNLHGGDQVVLTARLVDQIQSTSGRSGGTVNLLYGGGSVGYAWKVGQHVRIMPEISIGYPLLASVSSFGTEFGTGIMYVQGGIGFLFGD